MNKKLLADEIKKQLKIKGMSARKLSAEINKSPTYVNQLINERIQKLDYEDAKKIFSKLDLIFKKDIDIYLNILGIKIPKELLEDIPSKNIDNYYKKPFGEYIEDYIINNDIDVTLLENNKSLSKNLIYEIVKCEKLPDYKTAYRILRALDIKIPMNKIVDFFIDTNINPPVAFGIPDESMFYDKVEDNFYPEGFSREDYENYLKILDDELEEQYNQIVEQNKINENYPKVHKQKLLSDIDKVNLKLKQIIEHYIDENNYAEKHKYEESITTLIELILDKDGFKIFLKLFEIPLHTLDPQNLKDIVEFIDSKCDYHYIFNKPSEQTKEINSIYDLLIDYPYLQCVYKDDVWDDVSDSN